MKKREGGRLVYSTDRGRICPHCQEAVDHCSCSRAQTAPSLDGIVRVGRQTKGRKGKGVTVITGVPLNPEQLTALGRELKKKCGSGGTVKDGVIEIQGDHRDRLAAELAGRGWQVKRSGG